MKDYEVRLYRADNTLSIILKTAANDFAEVEATAWAMIKGNVVRAEIWDHKTKMAVIVPLTKE